MPKGLRPMFWFAAVSITVLGSSPQAVAEGADALQGLAKRIVTTSRLDSTAVLVVFDDSLVGEMRAKIPQSIPVVSFWQSNATREDYRKPGEVRNMFRQASAATLIHTDVWVVGMAIPSDPRVSRQMDGIADIVARVGRKRVLRDSVRTSRGALTFSRWVDVPGGAAQRVETRRALDAADSMLANGGLRPTPITRPFTPGELAVDPDTVSYLVSQLADTSFYSIGGCSDVEIVSWTASEKLGQMGPGVVPVLVHRIADPNPFVRERVQEALLYATQDDRILARTGGEYLKFYDQPARSPSDIVGAWWGKFGHFWTPADTTR